MRKSGGRALLVMGLFMVADFQASDAAEQLIKEFVDLIQERGTAEWVDAYGRPVGYTFYLDIPNEDQYWPGNPGYSRQIFFLSPITKDLLKIYIPYYYRDSNGHFIDHCDSMELNLLASETSFLHKDSTFFPDYLKIQTVQETIQAGDQNITLEGGNNLNKVLLSPSGRFIGGIRHLENAAPPDYITSFWEIPSLWDAKDGTLILTASSMGLPEEKYTPLDIEWGWFSYAFEVRFSPDERFFWVRGERYIGPQDSGKYEDAYDVSQHEYRLFLRAFLLDTVNHVVRVSDKDVAFTSDSRYYVTELDGFPALVESPTGIILRRYDTGKRMISAAFSPDNQKLYIGCEDNQIHVFDSHLPSHAAGWEVYP